MNLLDNIIIALLKFFIMLKIKLHQRKSNRSNNNSNNNNKTNKQQLFLTTENFI